MDLQNRRCKKELFFLNMIRKSTFKYKIITDYSHEHCINMHLYHVYLFTF